MARPLGSINKTPQEIEHVAKRLLEKAKLKRKLERLRHKAKTE